MNLSDPGTGKTPSVCVNQYRRLKQSGLRTIWIQPKSLMRKNKRELLAFTPLRTQDVAIVDGTRKQVDDAMNSNAGVLIMGPDRFKLIESKMPRGLAVDVDEFHMCFGGANSARTTTYLNYTRQAPELVEMTGTLVNGRFDTAWPAIHAIEPRYYPLGHAQFMAQHAVVDDYGRPLYWKNASKLSKIFGKHGIRRTFEQIFGKQEVVIQVREVDLSPKQLARYDEFEENAVIELEEVMISGKEGTNLIRCRQIMEHPRAFPDPRADGAVIDIVDGELTGKEESILIDLEDHARTGKPLIIFASLRPQQKALYKLVQEFGMSAALLDSSCSATERARIDEAFVAGRVQCLIGSAQIASVGFNWQFWGPHKIEVPHIIFASTNHMDGDFIQAYRRAIRQKRTTPLRVTVLRYANSIEKRIHANVCRKSRDANRVDPTREILEFA